jgi:uncharacterized glyoxalase superfamily protein PhnB
MTDQPDAAAQPPLVAHLCVARAADAIAFYTKALGAEELIRLPGPDGRLLHAAVRINGAMVMLNDEYPEMGGHGPAHFGGTAVTLTLNVPDADAAAARAIAAGAREIMPVAEQFWGDRYGLVEDPFGHRWAFATTVRQVSVDELQGLARSMG